MSSKLFRLNVSDLWKGLVVAVFAAVFVYLGDVFSLPGFDVMTFDWASVLNIALTAGVAYVAKNLLTSEDGKFAGIIG